MKTLDDIIHALGGNTATARIIGLGSTAVSEMKRRGRIDPKYWKQLRVAAADPERADTDDRDVFELTYDMLVDIHTLPEEAVAA